MASVCVSSEDDFDGMSERFESYSLSADVSESESSNGCGSGRFLCRRFNDGERISVSLTSSPFVGTELVDNCGGSQSVPIMLPVVGGRHVGGLTMKTADVGDDDVSG